MKKDFLKNALLLIIISISVISCTKDESDDVLISDVIVGSWFAVSSKDESSSIIYAESTSAITLTFLTNGTYTWILSNTQKIR